MQHKLEAHRLFKAIIRTPVGLLISPFNPISLCGQTTRRLLLLWLLLLWAAYEIARGIPGPIFPLAAAIAD